MRYRFWLPEPEYERPAGDQDDQSTVEHLEIRLGEWW